MPSVTILEDGRDGRVLYADGLHTLEGCFEFGGGDVVTIISLGPEEAWRRPYPWAVTELAAFSNFVAAEASVATRQQAVRKAEQRGEFQSLTSPVDGVVVEIAVNSIGEVVESGGRLATIVPRSRQCDRAAPVAKITSECKDEELIVEALVLNRDIGFISEGAAVVVKLEAFPFTRYGHVEGVVEHISADAIADENRGLVFPVRVRLGESRLRLPARAQATALQPGMLAQVDITTGSRTVMAYLLSPIAKATSEAGRER
jgi:hemolysin D